MKRTGVGVSVASALALLLCAAAVAVTALHITDQSVMYHRLDGAWAKGDVAVYRVKFSETVRFSGGAITPGAKTLRDLNGTDVTPNSDPNKAPAYAPHFLQVAGSVLLNCTRPDGVAVLFPSGTTTSNGMPVGLTVVPPTDMPLFSGLTAFGGLPLNASELSGVAEDTITAMLFVNGIVYRDDGAGRVPIPFANANATTAAFKTWQCVMVIGVTDAGANPNSIAVKDATNGYTVLNNVTSVFVERAPSCTQQGMTSVVNAMHTVFRAVQSVHRRPELLGAQIMSTAFSAIAAWAGCQQQLLNLFTVANASVPYPIATTADTVGHPEWHENLCPFSPGTFEFRNDPCCDKRLAAVMCCSPLANATATRQLIREYTDMTALPGAQTVGGLFQYKTLAVDFNTAHVKAEQARNRRVYQADDDWDTFASVESTCWTRVTTPQSCAIDTDCRYSSFCDTTSGTGQCGVNWDHLEQHLAPCYLDLATPLMRSELLSMLRVDETSATLVADVAAALATQLSQPDCVGPTASAARKTDTFTYDTDGHLVVTTSDGDPTACMSTYVCNWNAALSRTDCLDTVNQGAHTCGVSLGLGKYMNRRVRGRCVASELTDANSPGSNAELACTAIGGAMLLLDGNTAVRQCVFANVTTSAQCLALTSGSAAGTVSPFCATYAADIAARAALVPSESGNTFSKAYPIYSTLFAMCTAPSAQRSNGAFATASTGAFCYSPPGSGFTKANCSALAAKGPGAVNSNLFAQMQDQTYWVDAEGVCVSFFAGAAGPAALAATHPYTDLNVTTCGLFSSNYSLTSVPFQFHRPVRWQPAEYDSQTECVKGLCQHPSLAFSGVTAATCAAATTQCTTRCSGCRSALATTAGFLSEPLRRRNDGAAGTCVLSDAHCANNQYFAYNGGGTNQTFGATTKCVAQTDKWKCAALSGTYYECADLSGVPSTCPVGGITAPVTTADYIYQALKCQWSDSVPCYTGAQCLLSGGSCNDLQTTDCACTTAAGCTCATGTCVQPYGLDEAGHQRRCATGTVAVRVGCLNTTANTAALCAVAGTGYVWMPHGNSSAVCESHGTGCPSTDLAQGESAMTLLGQADCAECGTVGGVVPLHQWTHPDLLPAGTVLPMTWALRNWTTVNQWKTGVSRVLLQRAFDGMAARILTRRVWNQGSAQQTYATIDFQVLSTLLDVNGSSTWRLAPPSGLCAIPYDPVQSQVCQFDQGTVSTRAGTPRVHVMLSASMPSSVAIVGAPLAAQLFTSWVLTATTPSNVTDPAPVSSATYNVIQDKDSDTVVGRLMGPSVKLLLANANATTVTVCLERTLDIAADTSTYPVVDLATVKAGTTTVLTPLWLADAVSTGTAYCGTFSTAAVCSLSAVDGVTTCILAPITRVEMDTHSSSSLSTTWIVVIALAAAAVVVGGVMLLRTVCPATQKYQVAREVPLA